MNGRRNPRALLISVLAAIAAAVSVGRSADAGFITSGPEASGSALTEGVESHSTPQTAMTGVLFGPDCPSVIEYPAGFEAAEHQLTTGLVETTYDAFNLSGGLSPDSVAPTSDDRLVSDSAQTAHFDMPAPPSVTLLGIGLVSIGGVAARRRSRRR